MLAVSLGHWICVHNGSGWSRARGGRAKKIIGSSKGALATGAVRRQQGQRYAPKLACDFLGPN
jgi:hypothetical protein